MSVLRKTMGIIILIVMVVLSYFLQKHFNFDEQEKKRTSSSSLITVTPSTLETIARSETFVEKKSTFIYNDQKLQYLLIFPAKYTHYK